MRGALWALLPLLLAWWMRNWPVYAMPSNILASVRIVSSSLYSEKSFDQQANTFFAAAKIVAAANICLLSRAYLIVTLVSATLGLMARDFGRLRTRVANHRILSKMLHAIVLPRISEWHLALSPMLLANPRQYSVGVDVMTKGGVLYRGSVNEKVIGQDGTLQTLILTSVDRFLYPEFTRARTAYESLTNKKGAKKPRNEEFWHHVPGELFVIVGSEITSVNVRHVSTVFSAKPNEDAELSKILVSLNDKLQARLRDQGKEPDVHFGP